MKKNKNGVKTLMKYFFLFWIILTSFAFASDYFPEERQYTSADRGYTQYGTPSIINTSQFVLTFDDGPHPINTPKILDLLKQYNVKATFFAVISRIDKATLPIIKRILDEGHILASHDWEHTNNNTISEEQFKTDLKKSLLILNKAYTDVGHKMSEFYFRFPYAAYGETKNYHHMNVIRELSYELFGANCIQFIFWDIDSSDWVTGITPKEVTQNFISNYEGGPYIGYRVSQGHILKVPTEIKDPKKGGTILFHDIQNGTPIALKSILEFSKLNGLSFIPLNQTVENRYDPAIKCELKLK